MTCKVVVLISGRGSNLNALIQAENSAYEIVGVISNRPLALGLGYAQAVGISTAVVDHSKYASRAEFDAALAHVIKSFNPDFVALAGFMRLLGADLVQRWHGRMLNIHPSLLPAYTGLDTHQRVLADKMQQHGCSVHFVIPKLDSGPIIANMRLNVSADDNVESLSKRVLKLEHKLYPRVLNWLAEGRVRLCATGVVFDGKVLQSQGIDCSKCT